MSLPPVDGQNVVGREDLADVADEGSVLPARARGQDLVPGVLVQRLGQLADVGDLVPGRRLAAGVVALAGALEDVSDLQAAGPNAGVAHLTHGFTAARTAASLASSRRSRALASSRSSAPSAYWLAITCASVKRSEEHTSELQSRPHLVCRLLLEKKKKKRE